MAHLLFSYGTLQTESVQMHLFGRILTGWPDSLNGYELKLVEIKSASVIQTSGEKYHRIAIQTDRLVEGISGTVYELTDRELALCDKYEVDDYSRKYLDLKSGKKAWVYIGK